MPQFEQELCTCSHTPSDHDDGFGCTVADPAGDGPCSCLAGWRFEL